MSHYRGPRFKKIRHLGALPGLTSKRHKSKSDFKNQSCFGKKIPILHSSRRKTETAFSLWSDRTTIT